MATTEADVYDTLAEATANVQRLFEKAQTPEEMKEAWAYFKDLANIKAQLSKADNDAWNAATSDGRLKLDERKLELDEKEFGFEKKKYELEIKKFQLDVKKDKDAAAEREWQHQHAKVVDAQNWAKIGLKAVTAGGIFYGLWAKFHQEDQGEITTGAQTNLLGTGNKILSNILLNGE